MRGTFAKGVVGGVWRRYELRVLKYELDWASGKENGRDDG
jgi:hypothetical protein